MDTFYELNDETQKDLLNYIIECIDVAETLKLLSDNLFISYENRKQQFLTNSVNKLKLKAKCNNSKLF